MRRRDVNKLADDAQELVQSILNEGQAPNSAHVANIQSAQIKKKKSTKPKNWKFAYDMYCREIVMNAASGNVNFGK